MTICIKNVDGLQWKAFYYIFRAWIYVFVWVRDRSQFPKGQPLGLACTAFHLLPGRRVRHGFGAPGQPLGWSADVRTWRQVDD